METVARRARNARQDTEKRPLYTAHKHRRPDLRPDAARRLRGCVHVQASGKVSAKRDVESNGRGFDDAPDAADPPKAWRAEWSARDGLNAGEEVRREAGRMGGHRRGVGKLIYASAPSTLTAIRRRRLWTQPRR